MADNYQQSFEPCERSCSVALERSRQSYIAFRADPVRMFDLDCERDVCQPSLSVCGGKLMVTRCTPRPLHQGSMVARTAH